MSEFDVRAARVIVNKALHEGHLADAVSIAACALDEIDQLNLALKSRMGVNAEERIAELERQVNFFEFQWQRISTKNQQLEHRCVAALAEAAKLRNALSGIAEYDGLAIGAVRLIIQALTEDTEDKNDD